MQKLKQTKENLEKNFNVLEKETLVMKEQKEKLENFFEKEKNKNINLIDYINQDLKSLVDYFDNKFNSLIEDKNNDTINENKLTLNCFQNIEKNNVIKNINFETFIKAIIKGINSIKEKMNKDKESNLGFINQEKKYIQEINNLKEKTHLRFTAFLSHRLNVFKSFKTLSLFRFKNIPQEE